MNSDMDRPRGLLSPADRAYLLGEAEMEHAQSKRNAEARIRERVVEGITDFGLLVHALAPKDRRQIFEKSVDDDDFVDGVMAMLSFAYIGLEESGIDFEHVVEPAVRKAEEVHAADVLGSTVDVDVTFDVETRLETELDDVTERIRDGEPVTPTELFSVVTGAGEVLESADTVVVRRDADDADREAFLERMADYLDAEVEALPLNRVRLHLDDSAEADRAGSAPE